MSEFLLNDELVAKYLDGVADDGDLAALQEQLIANPETADALAALVRFEMLLHARLDGAESISGGLSQFSFDENGTVPFGSATVVSSPLLNDAECHRPTEEESAPRILSSQLPIPNRRVSFGGDGSAIYGTFGYFSSGWPVAYLVATVIFGIGLTIGALVHVSPPAQVARHPAALPSPLSPSSSVVGRITGMADCQWVQSPESRVQRPAVDSRLSSLVSLGDRFILSSGLMEITYNTGARVILQGPVTYEVESAAGGYLSLGKLTARLEKKVASGQWSVASKSEMSSLATSHKPLATSSNPQSLIANPSLSTTHYPLFTVRTPTASVTDLGTEFGVTVSTAGLTQVHVLQGAVDTRISGLRRDQERHEQVRVGHAVQIKPKSVEIESVAFVPQSFVRKLNAPSDTPAEMAYINAVLADEPLAYWPLNEPAHARRFLDRSGNGFYGSAMNQVKAGQAGPLLGNSRALGFEGKGYVDVGRHDEFARINDFTLEAWVCIGDIASQFAARVISATPGGVLSTDWPGRSHGWSLEASRQTNPNGVLPPAILRFTKYGVKDFEISIPSEMASEDRWVHVAVVCDRDNTAHFYLNGKHRQSVVADKAGKAGPVWLEIGGGTINDTEFWHGRLSHLAVYPQALNPRQIENHYNQRREK
jgi:hypothetical protein